MQNMLSHHRRLAHGLGGRPSLFCAALVAALLAPAIVTADEIEIGFMNAVYQDLDSNLQPIRQGSITIRVSSPEHRLTVHGNRLTLAANGDGSLDASMEVDFEGRGHLIADVESIGRFEDRVEAPRQTARAAGVVRLTRSGDNYLFTVVESDPSVGLEIKSGLTSQIVGACRVFAMLMSLPCDGLETSLSVIQVPMPEAGEQFQVRADLLSDEEKAFFEGFISSQR